MRYLVMRRDGIRSRRRAHQISSSCFPIEVDIAGGSTAEEIVRAACDQIDSGYFGMHEYVVIPLDEARLVNFKPKPSYEVHVNLYIN